MSNKRDKSKIKAKVTVDHNLDERVMRKVTIDVPVEGKSSTGKIDYAALRAGGFIKQRQKDKFTVRLNCAGGRMSVEKLKVVAEVADEFGDDFVHFSTRQSLEIPTVDYHDFNAMIEKLSTVDQNIASCGPRVRVPTACGGCAYNPNGITDTIAMAEKSCEMYFGTRTNHKFKMSFSGCPHDCIHTVQADLGFQGGVEPEWVEELCTGCTICSSACAEDAIKSHPETGQPIFNPNMCIYCDDCVRGCPTFAWKAKKKGHIIRLGGKGGRHPLLATVVAMFLTDEEALKIIDVTVKWYQINGDGKGRMRLGTLLREDGKMADYMQTLAAEFGTEKLCMDAKPPHRVITNPKEND